jgi:hypothetical protein
MDQLFINRVFRSVSGLESTPPCLAPSTFFLRNAPGQHNSDLSPGGICDAISGGTAICPFGMISPRNLQSPYRYLVSFAFYHLTLEVVGMAQHDVRLMICQNSLQTTAFLVPVGLKPRPIFAQKLNGI